MQLAMWHDVTWHHAHTPFPCFSVAAGADHLPGRVWFVLCLDVRDARVHQGSALAGPGQGGLRRGDSLCVTTAARAAGGIHVSTAGK